MCRSLFPLAPLYPVFTRALLALDRTELQACLGCPTEVLECSLCSLLQEVLDMASALTLPPTLTLPGETWAHPDPFHRLSCV